MSTPAPPVVGLGRVPAVAGQPRRLGAVLTAAVDDPNPDTRWEHGVLLWPEAAPGWRLVADSGDPEDHPDYGASDTGTAPYGARPFLIQTRTNCPRTTDLDELRGRAQRALDAQTSTAIARELWTGTLTANAPWQLPATTPFLLANPATNDDEDPGGPWLNPHFAACLNHLEPVDHPAAAVGAVEAAAMTHTVGGPVYIHVPPAMLLELSQFGIHPEGDRLHTPLGNVIVADAGYAAGLADIDDGVFVYATGPVQAWVGEAQVYDRDVEIVDTDTNAVAVWAERPALAVFDPQTLVGCQVT